MMNMVARNYGAAMARLARSVHVVALVAASAFDCPRANMTCTTSL